MDKLLLFFLFAAVLLILLFLFLRKNKKETPFADLPPNYIKLLKENVVFYNKLSEPARIRFEQRMEHFLESVRITGVNTTVEDIDRVLIAASAVIPIFGFPDWDYINLHEVLLYPETFNEAFEQTGNNRPVMGMVGNGPMNHIMILSQHALRIGFQNKTDKDNTAVHEFVHLLDKTDGDTDGIPEVLMKHQYVLPWVDMMHTNIREILNNDSDINPYGASSQAEFFAVVSEYFFERPDLLQIKHPELYGMLEKIFKQGKDIPEAE
ncbi:MAG: zinc-dependent peptidase [Bacteroidetes bacterium]|nr:zinc-dependent peptidase [Bacteroidota bacterium]